MRVLAVTATGLIWPARMLAGRAVHHLAGEMHRGAESSGSVGVFARLLIASHFFRGSNGALIVIRLFRQAGLVVREAADGRHRVGCERIRLSQR
jgi:hypothetical protein